ncbi:MAG: response regulator transcription factor, partial [Kordiimonas sp.]
MDNRINLLLERSHCSLMASARFLDRVIVEAGIMRVLIVEDNRDIAGSIADYLEIHGYVCDFAYSGFAGLQLATQNQYDIYIFDIALPGMDGLQLCNQLRQERKDDIPVIFLTARDTLDDKIAGFDAGADDYLVKPFELQELHVRLRAISKRKNTDAAS